jgi:2-dehydro-3-deoxyphosphogluconate aldolase/(4S)-4-hydroxy-2-oxoglutarate aldolase
MARFKRLEVYNKIVDTGIIPVFYNKDVNTCKKIIKACYEGGARIFEFTNRGNFAHEVFSDISHFVTENLPDMVIGVGSVVDGATASLYIQLGADFIVSPVLKEDMAIVCNRRKIPWMPGCGTLTEIAKAEELGAEIVKIFPASQIGGPSFIKNIKGPCPWTNILPTGGVKPTEENLSEWFNAGAFCVGMGSQLFVKTEDNEFDYPGIVQNMKTSIEVYKKIRFK